MNSTLGDDQRQKGDDESEGRSETMSEMSDYIPLGGSGRGPTTGSNPLSVSQMMATEDIDGAPLPPYSLTGAGTERKLSNTVRDSEGKSTSSTKRPSSVGRSGGISASSRLSGGSGSGGSRVGLGGTTRNLSQTPSSFVSATPAAPSTAAGTARRTSFGSSSRSMSGGGVNKPSR